MWQVAPRLGLIDQPDPRKVHKVAIPRVGGWGIVVGALLPIVILVEMNPLMQAYILGAMVLFIFGLWDDARDIGHYKKFVGQIIAVSLIIFHGGLLIERIPFLDYDSVPRSVSIPLTYFAMIGMINAVNHSDGLDGLAGGESLLSLIVIAFLAYIVGGTPAVLLCATSIGGILGFLRYNTYPAKVFMGDTGSQFLGFTLGFLAILLTQQIHTALSPAITLMVLGLPVIDIIAVLIQRIHHKMNWFAATRNHIHHRLLDLGFDHYETVIIIYLIQSVFVISAILLRYESDFLIVGLYFGFTALIFGTLITLERGGWRAHKEYETSALSGWIACLKGQPLIAQTAIKIVSVAVPAYLLGACLWMSSIPRDFAVVSAVLGVVAAIELISSRRSLSFLMRAAVYVAVLFTVFLFSDDAGSARAMHIVDLIYFAILAAAIASAVYYSSDFHFQTTPMDYLILFGVATIAVIGGRYLQVKDFSTLIIKAVILLYGCEIVIEKVRGRWNMLKVTTTLAFVILAFKGLR